MLVNNHSYITHGHPKLTYNLFFLLVPYLATNICRYIPNTWTALSVKSQRMPDHLGHLCPRDQRAHCARQAKKEHDEAEAVHRIQIYFADSHGGWRWSWTDSRHKRPISLINRPQPWHVKEVLLASPKRLFVKMPALDDGCAHHSHFIGSTCP